MKFVDAVGTRYAGKFHTNTDGIKMHDGIWEGAHEAHLGCSLLVFLWSNDFVRAELIGPVGPAVDESFTLTRMDSKWMLKFGWAHMKSIQRVWHFATFRSSISCAWSLLMSSEPVMEESVIPTRADSKWAPEYASAQMKSIGRVWYSVSIHASISCAWSLLMLSKPFVEERFTPTRTDAECMLNALVRV